MQFVALIVAALLFAVPALASDISSPDWSETDNSNTQAPPRGWPAGMAPNQVEPTARAMMGATKRFYDHINATETSAGTANAQTLTYDVSPTSLVKGDVYRFIVGGGLTNTGPTTLQINSLPAKNIYRNGAALGGGELTAGQVVTVTYDGTQFQLGDTPPNITGCANIKFYGGVADGITDNTGAFSVAASANSCIYFPAGTYAFTTPLTYNISGSFSIKGDGLSSVIKQTAGWTFNMTGPDDGRENTSSIHVSDLQFLATTAGTIAGIVIQRLDDQQNLEASSFDHVSARGSTPSNFYIIFVSVINHSSIMFNDLSVMGPEACCAGTAVSLQGSYLDHPNAQYSFSNSNFYLLSQAVYYATITQGLQVVNTNFTQNIYGVFVPILGGGSTHRDQISITNSQFAPAPAGVGVYVQAPDIGDILISNDLFIMLGSNTVAVYMNPMFEGRAIVNNNIMRSILGVNYGVAPTTSTPNTNYIFVTGNYFSAEGTSTINAIDYQNSVNTIVAHDNYMFAEPGATANPYVNLSSNSLSYINTSGNRVMVNTPTSCSGLPSGAVRSNAGVLTLCP